MLGSDMVSPCKLSIGEHVSNLRYLTRRFGIAQSNTTSGTDLYLELPSYYFGKVYNPVDNNLATYRITPIDYISWIYRFFRGGIRWKVLARSDGIDQGYQEAALVNNFESTREIATITKAVFDVIFVQAQSFWHRVYTILNPVLEVTVPYYSQVPVRPIVGSDTPQPRLLEDNAVLYHSHITGSSGGIDIMKAAHDDFSFGWLVGPPQLRPRVTPVLTASTPSTGITENGSVFIIAGVPITPSSFENGSYNILGSSPATLKVTYLDTSTADAEFTGGLVTKNGSTGSIRVLNPKPGEAIDVTATLATYNGAGSNTFIVSGPV
jgi:hypothetical protein